jgi:hypothetical protein
MRGGGPPPTKAVPPTFVIAFGLSSALALYVYHLKLQKRRRRR